MLLTELRLKVRDIVVDIGISHRAVVSILNHHYGMRQLSTRWVLRLITIEHKANRVTPENYLVLFNQSPDEILQRLAI